MIYACRLYLKNFWEKIKNFKLEVYNFTDNSFSIANCTFAIALFASSNCSPSLSLSLSLSLSPPWFDTIIPQTKCFRLSGIRRGRTTMLL